jgi:predicted nucleic acid-binding protein
MYLLDTNVISELRKSSFGRAHPTVAAWAESVATASLFLSAVTILELDIGVLRMERRDGVQGRRLRAWVEEQILPSFSGRILEVSASVARQCAILNVPNPQPYRDGLIAATALVHGLTVVTRNVADFASTGVRILNPWQS